MLPAMYTAIGGLQNHQLMLDVTAANIANVDTVGYKAQRTDFEAMVAQQLRGASAPSTTGGIGGTNPEEVGLGMTVGSIGTVLTQGSMQTTGQWSDLAINGDGYFIVSNSQNPNTATAPTIAFTRSGNFTVDSNGNLVDPHGQYVLGLANAAPTGPPPYPTPVLATTLSSLQVPQGATGVSIDQTGTVSCTLNGGLYEIGQIQLANFPNPGGLSRVGQNDFKDTPNSGAFSLAAVAPPPPAGVAAWSAPTTSGTGYIQAGALEMSNVDLSQEFTNMIVAQRGFQANARVITTSDEVLQELVNLKH